MMRFTVIGHSCLFIETDAGSILVDPWLVGSAYWRSWWHYPPSVPPRPEWLAPDFVYFTHHHFDHLHYPSVRKIDRGAQVLIPRFGVDKMASEMQSLGFTRVRELDHGRVVDLGRGVRVASFQYGFDDTTFVVADDHTVLVDLNDCKIRGRALHKVVEAFGRPTFAFKSYSFAQCYPITYTSVDPADLQLLRREAYIEDFVGRMREMAPIYAVPFGSMVAFLHPECRDLNEHLVSPHEVEAATKRSGLPGTRPVVMSPGDSWDRGQGFAIADDDWYSDRASRIEALARSVQGKLDEQAEQEATRTLAWEDFHTFFTRFVRSLPWPLGRVACKRPVVFVVPSSPEPYWVVDVARRRVARASTPPPDRAGVIRVSEAVLADAIDKRLVYFIHISMRARIELEPGGAASDLAFWGLVGIWELGYLDRRTLWSRRLWSVAWRRRTEIWEALGALRGRGSLSERMAGRLAEPEADQTLAGAGR